MAKYKVIKYFTDLQDSNFAYKTGDIFPREGKDVSPSRIAELAGSDNKRGVPLIELVKESTPKAKAEAVKDEAKSEDITEADTVEVEAVEEKPKTRAKRTTKK